MEKYCVHSEKEYVDLFRNYDLNDAEDFLGVEFAYSDGSYQDETSDENQEITFDVFRKTECSTFPDSYPCVVLLANDQDFDRFGSVRFKMLDFVYPGDFK
jgi:hypothetical protein